MRHNPLTEQEIFAAAFEIESTEARLGYLKQVCRNDELVERILALLQEGGPDASFLEHGPFAKQRADFAEDDVPRSISRSIGSYDLLHKIGEGGFGIVYLAQQTAPIRRCVALKIIKPGMDSREVIARFEAERQALALMDHPNIAKVLDGGTTESDQPFFVMELVKGIPLTEFCDRKRVSTTGRLELFATICHAIQHAHQKGVIHRDIKPSNVMVTLHDGKPVPKVIDFGVAKAINQQLTEKTTFTSIGQM